MTTEDFTKLSEEFIDSCFLVLNKKSKEYARGKDKLHNFKRSAALEQILPEQALKGMMSKQIISIYDMIDNLEKSIFPTCEEEMFDLNLWGEKIRDTINYLLLLWALLNERMLRIK